MKKNVLILGSGGREYAMAWKLSNDQNVNNIYCAPGNAGTAKIGINKSLPLDDYSLILDFVNNKNIDLIIVGPENLLDDGIVEFF